MRLTGEELQTFVRSAMLRARLNQSIVSIEVSDRYYVYRTLVPKIRAKEDFTDIIAVIPEGKAELWLVPKSLEMVLNGQSIRRAT